MGLPIGLITRAVIVFGLLGMLAFGVHYIHEDGRAVERGEWEAKLAKKNAEVANLIAANGARVRDLEHSSAAIATTISTTLQGQLKEKDNEMERMRIDLRAGRLARLRDPGPVGGAGANPVPGAPAGTGECGRTGGAELSLEADEFLRSEAIRANKVVQKLAACQALLAEDRRVCGAQPLK